jgi:hypothetical protein
MSWASRHIYYVDEIARNIDEYIRTPNSYTFSPPFYDTRDILEGHK